MKLSKRILSIGGFALLFAAGFTFGPAALPVFKAVTWGLGISLLANIVHLGMSQPMSRAFRSPRREEISQPIHNPANTTTVLTTPPTPAPGFNVMPPPHARTVVHTGRRVEPQVASSTVKKVSSHVVPTAGSEATLTQVGSRVIKATPPPSTPLYPVLTTTQTNQKKHATKIEKVSSRVVPAAGSEATLTQVSSKVIKAPPAPSKPLYPVLPPIQRNDSMKRQNSETKQVGSSSFVSPTPSNAARQVSSTFIPKPAPAPTPTYTPAAANSPQQQSNSTTTKTGGRFVPLPSNDEVKNVKSTFVPKSS